MKEYHKRVEGGKKEEAGVRAPGEPSLHGTAAASATSSAGSPASLPFSTRLNSNAPHPSACLLFRTKFPCVPASLPPPPAICPVLFPSAPFASFQREASRTGWMLDMVLHIDRDYRDYIEEISREIESLHDEQMRSQAAHQNAMHEAQDKVRRVRLCEGRSGWKGLSRVKHACYICLCLGVHACVHAWVGAHERTCVRARVFYAVDGDIRGERQDKKYWVSFY